MIDEDRTMQLFGYTSNELSFKSAKLIVVVCDECGKYRVLPKQRYRDLCISCAHCDVSGENNPMYGKHWSIEHKRKVSEKLLNRIMSDKT